MGPKRSLRFRSPQKLGVQYNNRLPAFICRRYKNFFNHILECPALSYAYLIRPSSLPYTFHLPFAIPNSTVAFSPSQLPWSNQSSTSIRSQQILSLDNNFLSFDTCLLPISLSLQRDFIHPTSTMARYRYTINHPNLKAAARVSDIPTKHAIEPLSPETPSHDPDPLPEQELLTYCEPDSLLTLSESCSQTQVARSTKVEPIRNVIALSTIADHHEILSQETPSSDPDPLPMQELLTPREPDSLLSSSESCSQIQVAKSTKVKPIRGIVSRSTVAVHHEILVARIQQCCRRSPL